ncbi:Pyrophosphate--fructose 6-phosphate 1-phosphotransferase [subsurface metagenome]
MIMANVPKANAVVGQSGGPTGVINTSLVGVIEEVCKHEEIENLYGAIHAVDGIVKEQFVDLKQLSVQVLEGIASCPSAALGSSRTRPDREFCEKIFEVFKKRNVRYFYYIGGNDSANTAHIINMMAADVGYEMRAFHIPKTIDNDLVITDHCPGYGTAAKFVACALMGDDLDNRALPGIKVDVLMGRHAGFLAAASALGRREESDGPHLVYFPEKPVAMDKFLSDVETVYKKLGRCVIAVSEGICDVEGRTWTEKIQEENEKDPFGNIQLSGTGALADFLARQIKAKIDARRVRADTFGYLQRSFVGFQSEVDVDEARRCGWEAVKFSMKEQSGSVAIRRIGERENYAVELFSTELRNVAEKSKQMPDEFINSEGNGITQSFIDYAMPLTGGLPRTYFLGEYPRV